MKTIGLIPSLALASLEQDAKNNWLNVPAGQTVVPLVKIEKPVISAGIGYEPKLVWFSDRVERQWNQIVPVITVPESVSKVGVLLAMAEKGLYTPDDPTSALTAAIASMSDPTQKAATQIFFQFETVVKRFHPVVLGLQKTLGLDDAAVDALFVAAKAKDNQP